MEKSSRPKRGRPRRTEGTKHITFKNSTYELWTATKAEMGLAGIDNSRFADILLLKVGKSGENESRNSQTVTTVTVSTTPACARRGEKF